jgi:ATP-dependent RNA helicase SUPV3L1/SUV3
MPPGERKKNEIKDRLNQMLSAQPKQFRLMDDGQIFYQAQATNPLPGAPLARIKKGQSTLRPAIDLIETDLLNGQDAKAVKDHLESWLVAHIAETLETLVGLEDLEGQPGPVRGICFQLHESMGIVPREQLEDLIKDLDQDMRQALRNKKVRLGPVLVFMPALNKPAGVRLRGLLWALGQDKTLPVQMPKDGMVSYVIDPKTVDRRFQQAIGYPVFGPRAIRIDMLDRVISAVYEGASEGKFKAEHKMAEWLGCSIEDLYAVLEAMGHRKIHDPAVAVAETLVVAEAAVTEETSEAPEPAVKPDPQVKPELATFRLKKGKAFEKPAFKPAQAVPKKEAKPHSKPHNKKHGDKKPRRADRDSEPKIMQSGPKPKFEDSPFAILQQLKQKKDGA